MYRSWIKRLRSSIVRFREECATMWPSRFADLRTSGPIDNQEDSYCHDEIESFAVRREAPSFASSLELAEDMAISLPGNLASALIGSQPQQSVLPNDDTSILVEEDPLHVKEPRENSS
jgi:hypothetical protein